MFQKCPLCNGTGIEPQHSYGNTMPKCSVCQGAKIISQTTGLPPSNPLQEEMVNFIKELPTDFDEIDTPFGRIQVKK